MAYATIRRGASQDGFFAVPVEGSSFFISASQLAQLSLHEGDELGEEQFADLRNKLLGYRCRQKAMDLLAMREHSRKELELKLLRKEFPKDIIARELQRLAEERLLSDQRFSEQFIASRQRRNPEGPALLIRRLQQRGVDRSVAEHAVYQWFDDEMNASDAITRAAGKLLRKGKDHAYLGDQLHRKGFSTNQIKLLFEEIET
jgi:regulatory protein